MTLTHTNWFSKTKMARLSRSTGIATALVGLLALAACSDDTDGDGDGSGGGSSGGSSSGGQNNAGAAGDSGSGGGSTGGGSGQDGETCLLSYDLDGSRFYVSGASSNVAIGPGKLVLRVTANDDGAPAPGTAASPAQAEVLRYEMDQDFTSGINGLASVETHIRVCLADTDFKTDASASMTDDSANPVEQDMAADCIAADNTTAMATLDFISESDQLQLTGSCPEGQDDKDDDYEPADAVSEDASCLTHYLSYGRVKCDGTFCSVNNLPNGDWVAKTGKWSQGLLDLQLSDDYATITMGDTDSGAEEVADFAQVPNEDLGWTGIALAGSINASESTCTLP